MMKINVIRTYLYCKHCELTSGISAPVVLLKSIYSCRLVLTIILWCAPYIKNILSPLAPNRSDSDSDTEPQLSEDEHSSSDDPGSTPSSEQSSSEQPSIASTLVVSSSEEDTRNQSIASRTMARHRTTSTAPLIENDTNDPPPTSQPTDDNPLTDLQDRQRAPLKQALLIQLPIRIVHGVHLSISKTTRAKISSQFRVHFAVHSF